MVRTRATSAIEIDDSSDVIENAKREFPNHSSGAHVHLLAGYLEQSDLLQHIGLAGMRSTFDVVFAAWLLNYAADWTHMAKMLANVCDELKPGERLVGSIPNPFLLKHHGPDMGAEKS